MNKFFNIFSNGKQWKPYSNCRSCLIWVYVVCMGMTTIIFRESIVGFITLIQNLFNAWVFVHKPNDFMFEI